MHLIKKHINILLPLLIISAISRRFIPELRFLYYLTPVLLVLFIVVGYDKIFQKKRHKTLTIMLLAFGLWAMITALWSDHPLYSLGRAGYFVLLVFGSVSAITFWSNTKEFKNNPFSFLLFANIFLIVVSLLSLFFDWPEDAWTGGNKHGFMGIFQVQLSLGSAMLVTLLAPLYNLLKLKWQNVNVNIEEKKNYNFKQITINVLLLALSILVMILSHSRAALLSLFILGGMTLFILFNNKQKLYFVGFLILIPLIITSNSFLKTNIEKYLLKGSEHITANRDILWSPTWEAAKFGGIAGIGYGISDSEIITQYQITDHNGILRREKGSSFLALIEEVGIIGLILFLIPSVFVFKNYLLSKNKILALTINISMLVALVVHAQFESWMVGLSEFNLLIFLMFLFLTNILISKQ